MKILEQQGTNHVWKWHVSKTGDVTIAAGCFTGSLQELVNKIYKYDDRHLIDKRINLVKQACKFFRINTPSPLFCSKGYGNGKGDGIGYGYGIGNGYGKGDGYGIGNGYGKGDGIGYGNGIGKGNGYGKGDGIGKGNGDGIGYGIGYGNGIGIGI